MPKPELRLEDTPIGEEDIGDAYSSVSTVSFLSASTVLDDSPYPSPAHLSRSATPPPQQPQPAQCFSLTQDITNLINRYILSLAVVDFDVDTGPVLSSLHPPLPFKFLPGEKETIAFSSLPDSKQGQQIHSFRIRCGEPDDFVYAFAYFVQRQDQGLKRGYEQRSLVILTLHPYPAFFTSLLYILGPLFADHGMTMLEAACHNIASWSDPTPGSTIELGFLGTVLHIAWPHNDDEQQEIDLLGVSKEAYDPQIHILATSPSLHPSPLLLFASSLSHLWSIWECLILSEPILIFGSSPSTTSQAIWFLRDLLRPLPITHAIDIRPYFTIHDRDYPSLVALGGKVKRRPPKAGLVLGVTNPFFERECHHWPHILSLGGESTASTPSSATPKTSALPSAGIRTGIRTPLTASGSGPGPTPGWKTKTHKRYISKDRKLLKSLETNLFSGSASSQLEACLILRRHFYSRTNEMLVPLTRYLNTLIPTPLEIQKQEKRSGVPVRLRLKPFNTTQFFLSLKKYGSTLPFKSQSGRVEFYERWLKSPMFGAWIARQEGIVDRVLREGRG